MLNASSLAGQYESTQAAVRPWWLVGLAASIRIRLAIQGISTREALAASSLPGLSESDRAELIALEDPAGPFQQRFLALDSARGRTV